MVIGSSLRNAFRCVIPCGEWVLFDVSLDMMHHRHGTNQDDGCNDLMCVKAGVEETPRDANGSERLHHFEIPGRRCAREV